MENAFYYCETCGNLLIAAIASGVTPVCCGDEMKKLTCNTSDGNKDHHLPVVTLTSAHSMIVNIGAEPHPMTPQHNIRFVCLQTSVGFVVRYLKEDDLPEVKICFKGKPVAVYAYCSIHGLWRSEIPECSSDC